MVYLCELCPRSSTGGKTNKTKPTKTVVDHDKEADVVPISDVNAKCIYLL